MTTDPDADAWAAALTLYEKRCAVVVVGPRRHEDWELDVAALLRRKTRDPRGWKAREFYEEEDDEWSPGRIAPLVPPGPSEWRARLRKIQPSGAERLLVAISTNWLDVTREPGFEADRPALEKKARILLARFPAAEAEFFTNAWYGVGDATDFYSPLKGCDPFSEHDWDVGLLAVSGTEVGVFWSFDAT
ncbi:hypothetical protein ACIQU5_00095 [Streptomyces sp. NPDC090306]|uniref:hypothetical protein n=1 Tax=unclassified Streptomyces TaxID=2593676 RepID=UPI0036EE9298